MTLRSSSGLLTVTVDPDREHRCACACDRYHRAVRACDRIIRAGAVYVDHTIREVTPGTPRLSAPICRPCALLRWPAALWEET